MSEEPTDAEKHYIESYFPVRTQQEISDELGIPLSFVQRIVEQLGLLKKHLEEDHQQELGQCSEQTQ